MHASSVSALFLSVLLLILRRCSSLETAGNAAKSRARSVSYIAAVAEYRPVTEGIDGKVVAERNALHVRRMASKASEYGADIAVFPEVGLTSLPADRSWHPERIRAHYAFAASIVPSPDQKMVLCDAGDEYARSLKSISCTARDYKMYIVVNHYEKQDCPEPNCSPDNFLLYNTNVAFDREGRLIARYRKYNLFSEPGINITDIPEISTFDTDFGVTFGQIICNDILYVKPALEIVKRNITDVVFSAEWFSELPFLTSVEMHSAWAYMNNVNLLSSGFNEPAITNGGSGIYLGREGIIKATIPNESANVLVVAEVPKIVNGQRQNKKHTISPQIYRFSQAEIPTTWDNTEKFMYKDDFSYYTTEIIDPRHPSHNQKLCNHGLCCNFKLETYFNGSLTENNDSGYYRYRIGVFKGVRLFAGTFTVGIEVCGLFFCQNDSLASCGDRFSNDANIVYPTNFHSIDIERETDDDPQKFYLPVTLSKFLLPIDASKIKVTQEERDKGGQRKTFRMSLSTSVNDLMAFAVYGRNLKEDGTELTKSVD